MARSDGYNTKTRQLILDYLIRNRQHAVSASPRWTVTRIFIPYCAAVLILFVKTCATP